ncbi:Transcriptional regulator, histidine kinase sensor [Desulfovibrio sp. X2]|uniref:PocR ligand-binding domain-containing protein n=1 Tax=Desulfovibrio sp. X2 TaxID=941449 RepID=UPI0003587396|nr:PocR ligand-binding domain-containing protein [Desulfovibrio sp. X2]EPR43501.1 Transcriptional regulator, histidine kinase sensor [Desulfovibrio sp. X2]
MTLTDLLDVSRWEALERNITTRLGLNPGVFHADGRKVTGYSNWVNPLCPAVRAVPNGLSQICSCANQVISRKAERDGPVVEECDAGLCKIAVPIFAPGRNGSRGEFLGVAGGCGARIADSALGLFHVGRVTGLAPDRLEELAASVPTITPAMARHAALQIADWVERMLPAQA